MLILYKNKALFFNTFIAIIFILTSPIAKGQFFDSGQNPPGVKWRQINTTHFQIIYPTSVEMEAQRMANTLETVLHREMNTLKKQPHKISIILQNQGTESNGFVQLAPRRSEFFTTPPQEFDYQDWLNSLAVHELRHVVQFDKLSGSFKAPFFEDLALSIFGISLPPWFYEGDAVGTETALTNAGRGRLPEWELIFRTNTLSGRKFSYSKDYLGSLRDLSPGYYQLGYFMTTKLRRDHGKNIIDSLFTRMARNPFRPYNLSSSIKKFTGMNTRQLHDSTVTELNRLWQGQLARVKPAQYAALNIRLNQTPADYLLPVAISTNQILALKQSKNHSPTLVMIEPSGEEKNVLKIGYQEQPNFRYAAGKIVWDEFRFDKRYQKRSFSVVNLYDLNSKKYQQLSHRSKLFAPTLSPDGKTIAAVKMAEDNSMSIIELETSSGKQIREYPNPDRLALQTPSFNATGNRLVLTVVSKEGTAISEIDRQSGEMTQLLPFQQQLISNPVYAENLILFRAHFNGLDNIFLLEPSKTIRQVTSAPYGAYNASYNEASGKIFFNNYQVNGQDITSIHFPKNSETSTSLSTEPFHLGGFPEIEKTDPRRISNTFINYAQPLAEQENSVNVFEHIPNQKYTSKPYREINNLFYFHSLLPIAENSSLNNNLNIGAQLQSNNKLNTLDFYAGYQYNSGLNKSEYLAGFTYKRFYPILDVSYINRARLSYTKQVQGNTTVFIPVNWREDFTQLELGLPFRFNQLNQNYNLGLQIFSSYTNRYQVENRPANFISTLHFPMKYQLYLNRNTIRSARDLAPRWGQNITLSYQHFPFENHLNGNLFSLRTLFYAPGLLPNHSLLARFSYQQHSGTLQYNIDIPQVSGYSHLNPVADLRNTLLLNYRFPLFYPDLEIGRLAYIKRFRAGFFSDFENIKAGNFPLPRTYGLDLNADMNLLRFYLPNFSLGGKIIFVNEKRFQNPIFELGLGYSL